MIRIRSRIKEIFNDELMMRLEKIYRAKSALWIEKEIIEDCPHDIRLKVDTSEPEKNGKLRVKIISNNDKIAISKMFLIREFGNNINFGTGTNRFALIKDGYVYKIANDNEGVTDNLHEFYMSQYLQPYVTKCYECNGLICVHEYVKVYSKEEEFQFKADKNKIMKVLEELAEDTSLMIDVGYITKNRSNWGIRQSSGQPVILDYGYIYTELDNIDLICNSDSCNKTNGVVPLHYTADYSTLMCPKCKKRFNSEELHALVTEETRYEMYETSKENRRTPLFKVDKTVSYFEVDSWGEATEIYDVGETSSVKDSSKILNLPKEKVEEYLNEYIDLCKEIDDAKFFNDIIPDEKIALKNHYHDMLRIVKFNKNIEDMSVKELSFDPYYEIDRDPEFADFSKIVSEEEEIEDIIRTRYPKASESVIRMLVENAIHGSEVNDILNYDSDEMENVIEDFNEHYGEEREEFEEVHCPLGNYMINEDVDLDTLYQDTEVKQEEEIKSTDTSDMKAIIDSFYNETFANNTENSSIMSDIDAFIDDFNNDENEETPIDESLIDVFRVTAHTNSNGEVENDLVFVECWKEENLAEIENLEMPTADPDTNELIYLIDYEANKNRILIYYKTNGYEFNTNTKQYFAIEETQGIDINRLREAMSNNTIEDEPDYSEYTGCPPFVDNSIERGEYEPEDDEQMESDMVDDASRYRLRH